MNLSPPRETTAASFTLYHEVRFMPDPHFTAKARAVIALLALNLLMLVSANTPASAEPTMPKGVCDFCIRNGDLYVCCYVEVCGGGLCCSSPAGCGA